MVLKECKNVKLVLFPLPQLKFLKNKSGQNLREFATIEESSILSKKKLERKKCPTHPLVGTGGVISSYHLSKN